MEGILEKLSDLVNYFSSNDFLSSLGNFMKFKTIQSEPKIFGKKLEENLKKYDFNLCPLRQVFNHLKFFKELV